MRHRGVLKVVAAAAAAVLGLLAFAGPAQSTPAFDDVDGNEFFGPAVDWMETQGLTTGVGGTEAEPSPFFEPFGPVDRAQLATFLWRMAGSPEPTLANDGFTDTDATAYYGPAVRWLRQQGYTTGIGGTPQAPGTTFEPHTQVDRAQAITLLWRYGGQPGPYGPHGFRDVDPGPPPTYFEAALRWAAAEGITTGYGGSDANPTDIFVPFEGLTRGQMAALVWRYAGNPAPNQQGCLAEGEWPCEDDTPPPPQPTTTTTPPTTTTPQPPDPEADLQLTLTGDEEVVDGEEAEYSSHAVNEGDASIDEDITIVAEVWDPEAGEGGGLVEEAVIEWWDGADWVDDPIAIPGGTIDPDYDETIDWRVLYPEAGDFTFFVSYIGDDFGDDYATDGFDTTVLSVPELVDSLITFTEGGSSGTSTIELTYSEPVDCDDSTDVAEQFTLVRSGFGSDRTGVAIDCDGTETATVTFSGGATNAETVDYEESGAESDHIVSADGVSAASPDSVEVPELTTPELEQALITTVGTGGSSGTSVVELTYSEPVDCNDSASAAAQFTLVRSGSDRTGSAIVCDGTETVVVTFSGDASGATEVNYAQGTQANRIRSVVGPGIHAESPDSVSTTVAV